MNGFQTLTEYRATSEASPTMPYATHAMYFRTFLAVARPKLVHDQFGTAYTLKKKTGEQCIWRRWLKLPPNIVPLADGITPPGKKLAYENVIATVRWYGDWVGLTDQVNFFHVDNVLMQATEKLGIQAGETRDIITRDIINAGTAVLRCVDGEVNTSGTRSLTYEAISDTAGKEATAMAATMLEGNDAPYWMSGMGASTKVTTSPIGPAYIAIVHPHVVKNLRKVDGWIPREKYAAGTVAYPTEVGSIDNIRFVMTTFAKVWADTGSSSVTVSATAASGAYRSTSGTNADVYSILVIAEDAYGVVKLQGSAATYYDPPGGQGDPLHQRSTAGWKFAATAKILDDSRMVRIECLALW